MCFSTMIPCVQSMAVPGPSSMVGVPSRSLSSSRVAVHGARSLDGCRDSVGASKHPRWTASGSTATQTKAAPAVTQKAIDTMFQKDSAEQVQHSPPFNCPHGLLHVANSTHTASAKLQANSSLCHHPIAQYTVTLVGSCRAAPVPLHTSCHSSNNR